MDQDPAVAHANRVALVWLLVVGVLTAYLETASSTHQAYAANHLAYEKNVRSLAPDGPSAPAAAANMRLENQLLRGANQPPAEDHGGLAFLEAV